MTLRDELRDLIDHTPEGVRTVTLEVDWLRDRLEESASNAGEAGGESGTYLTTSETARRLSVEPETIARWCRDGRFPDAFKTDPEGETGEWRIPTDNVRRMREKADAAEDRVHFDLN